MSENETKPPALPGEVWRGVIRLRPVEAEIECLCAVAPSPELHAPPTLLAWRWLDHADAYPTLGKWRELWGEARHVFLAWALAERARAEKAEQIAAAERALRWAIERGDDTGEREQRAALRALGVEP